MQTKNYSGLALTLLFDVYSLRSLLENLVDNIIDAALIIDEDTDEKCYQQRGHGRLNSADFIFNRIIHLLLVFDLLLELEAFALLLLHNVFLGLVHVSHAQVAEQLLLLLLGLLSRRQRGLHDALPSLLLFFFSAERLNNEVFSATRTQAIIRSTLSAER